LQVMPLPQDFLSVFHSATGALIWCSKVNLAGFRLQVVVDGQIWHCACRRVGVALTLPIVL
jgi:hypothetical protein